MLFVQTERGSTLVEPLYYFSYSIADILDIGYLAGTIVTSSVNMSSIMLSPRLLKNFPDP